LWAFIDLGSEPERVNAADLDTIRDRGYLIVGVKDTVRPLGFRDAAGVLQGLEIDLARQLAEELIGDREAISLIPLDNDERLSAVYDRVDVTIAQVSINASRERLVQFSLPYWLDGTAIVIPDRCVIATRNCVSPSVADLSTRTIAVLRGSDAIAALHWQFPHARLVGVESYQAALDRLDNGEADAFAGNRSVAIGWAQEYPGYRVLPEYVTMRSLAIVLPKGVQYDTLRVAVNDSLERWGASGWLAERIEAWGLVIDD
jgi:polar amino acid transport system substrate-binding protein